MGLLSVWVLGGGLHPGGFITTGLAGSLLLGTLLLAGEMLWRPLRRIRSRRRLVQDIEGREPRHNLLVAGEEALRDPARWSATAPVTRELVARLFHRADRVLADLAPTQVAPLWRPRWVAVGLGTVLAAGLWLWLAAPGELTLGLSRLTHPVPGAETVYTGGLVAVDGPGSVIAGRDLTLSAMDYAAGAEAAVCEIRFGSGLWQEIAVTGQDVATEAPGLPAPGRVWTATVPDVTEDFAWRFRRRDMATGSRAVTVRHYPLLTGLGARVQPPAYTGLPVSTLDRLPAWIEVPAGSRLYLSGQVNHPVEVADLVTAAGDTLPLTRDGTGLSTDFTVTAPLGFTLRMRDGHGLPNVSPLTYEIAVTADQIPTVTLERPDDNGVLPLEGTLSLLAVAGDDFGLTRLDLETRILRRDDPDFRNPDLQAGWQRGTFWTKGTAPATRVNWDTPGGPVSVETRLQARSNPPLRLALDLDLDVGALDLVPGDALEIRITARDNRQPPPAGYGTSGILRLVLPSAAEVLVSQVEKDAGRQDEMEEMRNRGKELGADLERLTRELMKNPVPDWARQQEMEAALKRQQALQKELERVARELKADLDKLAAGQLTSERMLEKAEEFSRLLSPDENEQLADLMSRLEQEGGQVSPQEVANAMQEVARKQAEMARKMDAALAMLERMSQEQEMEGIASLLEKMMRNQQELVDQSLALEAQAAEKDPAEGDPGAAETPEGDPADGEQPEGESSGEEPSDGAQGETPPSAEELARRQEALAQEMEQLQEKMEKALENLQEESDGEQTPSQEKMEQALQEALEQMEQQKQDGKMQKASEQLEQMDPGKAAEMQQQALRDLGALYHVMLETQQAMEMAMQANQVTSLRQLAADLLALSTRQEEIYLRLPNRLRDVRSLGLTRSQHRLQKAANGLRADLSDLLAENPTRIMKLLKKLDGVVEEMGGCVEGLENNNASQARRGAGASLASVNGLVISLLIEAQMSSASGGSGSQSQPSASEKLQEMIKEQARLNGLTDELRQMLADRGMSQAARAQMQRLGEAQGNLAQQLQEMDEEARQSPEGERMLGDMRELAREMEQVTADLGQDLVSEETLQRQDRILGRLLDARNSVRRRDYSSRRESQTASELFRDNAGRRGGGDNDPGDDPFRLRYQPLEKAPLEYRDLVRRYFAALDSLRSLAIEDGPAAQGDLP